MKISILEVMEEKYGKNTSQKILEVMRKISGETFRQEDDVGRMLDRFEDMVLEVEKTNLARRLNYALGSQFLERVQNSGKKIG